MIKSGCPTQICKKCGKARVRMTKVDVKKYRYDRGEHSKKFSIKQDVEYIRETIGWTDCGCNAGWEAGVVLDPFLGSGTTMKVARDLGRSCIGIELNPNYIEIAKRRVKWGYGLFIEWEFKKVGKE